MNLSIFSQHILLYSLIWSLKWLGCKGFYPRVCHLSGWTDQRSVLSAVQFESSDNERIGRTSWMKYLQNGAILMIDGDNVRGKTYFQLSKEELCEGVTFFLQEYGLTDQTIVAFDHGFEEEGLYLRHHSLAIVFSGPGQKADDVIARDILWLQKTFHLPILLVTDDFLLSRRTQSMTNRVNLFSKYLGKPSKSGLLDDRFAQQGRKSRPKELRILSSKLFLAALYGESIPLPTKTEPEIANQNKDNLLKQTKQNNVTPILEGMIPSLLHPDTSQPITQTPLTTTPTTPQRNPRIQIEINTIKKEYILLSKLQLYCREISNPILLNSVNLNHNISTRDTSTATNTSSSSSSINNPSSSTTLESPAIRKLNELKEELKQIYSQYLPYHEERELDTRSSIASTDSIPLPNQEAGRRNPSSHQNFAYCYNIFLVNTLNEKGIGFRKLFILQRLAYYRTFHPDDYLLSLQNSDNPDNDAHEDLLHGDDGDENDGNEGNGVMQEDLWDRILDTETFRLALRRELSRIKDQSPTDENNIMTFPTKLSIYVDYFNQIRSFQR